jgi:CheY-like chemotaxis protein
VLVITAQPGHKLRALQAGAKDFISKPFDLVEAKTRIHNMLEVRLLYKALEHYTAALERRWQERTAELRESEARFRSLTELASDWYWEQDDNMRSPRFPARCWRCSASGSIPWTGSRRPSGAGTRPSGHGRLQATIAARQPFLDLALQPGQPRTARAAVPGQRRADVQSGLPLHRLPRHRRGSPGRPLKESHYRCLRPRPQGRPRPEPEPSARRPARGEWRRLAAPELRPALGDMLYEPGEQMHARLLPHHAIVSLHYVMESGASAETAGVGNEGVVGVSLFMGGDTTPSSAVVQTAGTPTGWTAGVLKQEFHRAGTLQRLLLRYTQALMTQMSQTAACYRHHSVEQQLCRWLLLTLDRMPVASWS